jgi:hypothetical protein
MSDDDDSLVAGIPARIPFSRKKVKAQKFTKGTKAYKHLEKLFQDKLILPTEKPSDVRMKDPLFMDFTNQQFRSQFNKLKSMHGTCTKEGTTVAIQRPILILAKELTHCTTTIFTGFRKLLEEDSSDRKKASASNVKANNDADGDDDALDEKEGDEDPLAWIPKKIVSVWNDDDGIRCISVIIQLSGGSTLNDSNDVEVQVSNTGDELAVSEVWCPLMADARHFYTTFPKHRDETEENALRKRIAMSERSDTMSGGRSKRSTYRMPLPFRVDPSVKRIQFLGTEDGKRYATIDLAERSMLEVETFKLFTTKLSLPNSDKKRKHNTLF